MAQNIHLDPNASLDQLPQLGDFPLVGSGFNKSEGITTAMGIRTQASPSSDDSREAVFPARVDSTILSAVNQLPLLERLSEEKDEFSFLEIGAGQAFTGIAAAKFMKQLGRKPKVFLTDMNPKAAILQRNNIELNDLEEGEEVTVLRPQKFAEDLGGNAPDKFDAIYVNPPFLQKFPLLTPFTPLFGDAGSKDGMDVYNDWFQHIPAKLNEGGVVFGVTMSPVDDEGNIKALTTAAERLGPHSHVEYFDIVPAIDTKTFLTLQYRETIEKARKDGDTTLAENFEQWINHTSAQNPRLAYVYFEASNSPAP